MNANAAQPVLGTLGFAALGVLLFGLARSYAASGDEFWDEYFGVPGANGSVHAMVAFRDDLYVGGAFSAIGGITTSCIARWDGTNWHALGGGVAAEFFPVVLALTVVGDQLYAGGVFTTAGGVPVNHIARWDGTTWWPLASGVDSPVHGVNALATDGRALYAGGKFTSVGGVAATNIARWDGTNWNALGEGMTWWRNCTSGACESGSVDALTVAANQLYAGGRFDRAGGVSAIHLAQWDGTRWSAVGVDISGFGVNTLARRGAQVYVGGRFWIAGAVGVTNIARWDGNGWLPLDGGIDPYGSVGVLSVAGEALYVGGFFSSAGEVAAGSIARWDGGAWMSLGGGTWHAGQGGVGSVNAIAALGADLFVGGGFTSVGGKPATNIALWHIPHALEIARQIDQVRLSWPATGSNLVLEASPRLPATAWVGVSEPPSIVEDQLVVTNRTAEAGRFYRLRRNP